MFQITPSASSTDVIVPDNVFQVCYRPEPGRFGCGLHCGQWPCHKVATIYDSSDAYSSGIYNAFAAEAEPGPGDCMCRSLYRRQQDGFQDAASESAERRRRPGVPSIYYQEAALILTQADQLGYEPLFFGCDGMDGILALDNFDTVLAEGLMLMTPFNATSEDERTANFVQEYEEKFGGTPNQFAADAYDAVYAIRDACVQAGVTSDMRRF